MAAIKPKMGGMLKGLGKIKENAPKVSKPKGSKVKAGRSPSAGRGFTGGMKGMKKGKGL